MRSSIKTIHGDCCDHLPSLGKFDLIFADPPFNINQPYREYVDKRSDYETFTQKWIKRCWAACDGVLALHGPDDLVEPYLCMARKLGMRRIGWVNWHYRFGQCGRSNWIDARCHCLFFSKYRDYTWNPEEVLVESDRVKYGDKRVHETERGGQRLPGTVWGVPSDGPYWEDWNDEVIRSIPGYNGYSATITGLIISHRRETPQILQPYQNPDGYLTVKLPNKDGKFERIGVHVLICTAFHGDKLLEGHQCRHLDGIKTNNHADNLCWGTAKENAADRSAHGRTFIPSGEKHPGAKLTRQQVEVIRNTFNVTYKEIGKAFGVSAAQVSRIKNGEHWNDKEVPSTVFGIEEKYFGRVQGNSKERRKGHPNQLPEVYLERIIRAYSNPGDNVLDPFGGSGTTAVVCQALGRNCVTIDVSLKSIASLRKRLLRGSIRVK